MTNSKWLIDLNAHLETQGIELTKRELYNATPLYVNVTTNPKLKGTMAHSRFASYFTDGIVCIGDALAAGLRQDDIRHDSDKGFILLGDRANEAYEIASRPVALLTYEPMAA